MEPRHVRRALRSRSPTTAIRHRSQWSSAGAPLELAPVLEVGLDLVEPWRRVDGSARVASFTQSLLAEGVPRCRLPCAVRELRGELRGAEVDAGRRCENDIAGQNGAPTD